MFCGNKPSYNKRRAKHIVRHNDHSYPDASIPTIQTCPEEKDDFNWGILTWRVYRKCGLYAETEIEDPITNVPCLLDSFGDPQQVLQFQ